MYGRHPLSPWCVLPLVRITLGLDLSICGNETLHPQQLINQSLIRRQHYFYTSSLCVVPFWYFQGRTNSTVVTIDYESIRNRGYRRRRRRLLTVIAIIAVSEESTVDENLYFTTLITSCYLESVSWESPALVDSRGGIAGPVIDLSTSLYCPALCSLWESPRCRFYEFARD